MPALLEHVKGAVRHLRWRDHPLFPPHALLAAQMARFRRVKPGKALVAREVFAIQQREDAIYRFGLSRRIPSDLHVLPSLNARNPRRQILTRASFLLLIIINN